MRAAVLYEFGAPLHIQEVETDPPGRGEGARTVFLYG